MKKLFLFTLLSLASFSTAFADTYIENPKNANYGQSSATSYPNLTVNFWGQLQHDYVVSSEGIRDKANDLYWTLFPTFNLNLSPKWTFQTTIALEPNSFQSPDDRWFDDHGLYVDRMLLQYRDGPLYLYGGFMVPKFAVAWERAPGVFGVDIAEYYPMYDRLIIGGEFENDMGKAGKHVWGAYTFVADTTIFSNSTLQERGRLHQSDGGVSNTGDLESYAFTLEGRDIDALPGLEYFAHYARQTASGINDQSDESRYAFAVIHSAKLTEEILAETLLEYVRIDDADGIEAQRREFTTAGLKLMRGEWNTAVAYNNFDESQGGITAYEEDAFQISFGKDLGGGLSADLGWKLHDQNGIEEHVIGLVFTYLKDFE